MANTQKTKRSQNPQTVVVNNLAYRLIRSFSTIKAPFSTRDSDSQEWKGAKGLLWKSKYLENGFWYGINSSFDAEDLADEDLSEFIVRDEDVEKPEDEKLADVCQKIKWGPMITRILLAVYQRVWVHGRFTVTIDAAWLARRVWGTRRPKKWLKRLKQMLRSLCLLFCQAGTRDALPSFTANSSLIQSADWKDQKVTVEFGGAFKKHMVARPEQVSDALRKQSAVRVYLPIHLGDPATLGVLNDRQRFIVELLTREVTRRSGNQMIYKNGLVPDSSGRGKLVCRKLEPDTDYIGFNGNRRGHGCGYHPGEWKGKLSAKDDGQCAEFFSDLAALTELLGLVVVGLTPDSNFLSLDALLELCKSREGIYRLRKTQIRIYTSANWQKRWAAALKWPDEATDAPKPAAVRHNMDEVEAIRCEMKAKNIQQSRLADDLGATRPFVSMVLSGKKQCPPHLLKQMREYVQGVAEVPVGGTGKGTIFSNCKSNLDFALAYRRLGWSIVPMRITPEGKRIGAIKWSKYKQTLPTEEDITSWWTRWPDALIALVLGPLSGVFAIDSDGPEAWAALKRRLGGVPMAPGALSGSRLPGKFHLFFKHPKFNTKATCCPWYDHDGQKLEFRGNGGLLILAPSRHPSGKTYIWLEDRTLEDLSLGELPQPILDELAKNVQGREEPAIGDGPVASVELGNMQMSSRTRALLSGRHAYDNNWNNKIFSVACDLKANQVPYADALAEIAKAFLPRTPGDQNLLLQTVESAFQKQRVKSRI